MKCTTCGGMGALGLGGAVCSRCCGSGEEPRKPVAGADDLVARLRRMADMTSTDNDVRDIERAADEIERQRAIAEHAAQMFRVSIHEFSIYDPELAERCRAKFEAGYPEAT